MDKTTRCNMVVDTLRLYLGWMYLESDRLLLIFLPACRCTKSRCRLTVSHQTLQYKYIKLYSTTHTSVKLDDEFMFKGHEMQQLYPGLFHVYCTLVYFKFIVPWSISSLLYPGLFQVYCTSVSKLKVKCYDLNVHTLHNIDLNVHIHNIDLISSS